ncbi:hypothetical protein CFAM422_008477 [Trichoderma lentiforme]|uniref:Uncharacterized protein n=1 Tax=Trichoderma lentiforme TaxID=1567552 RepID=A0A9P4XB79_9HYPO|nr:hypothetical protein CFAM422_008477 [Trichoderma lentiforme]
MRERQNAKAELCALKFRNVTRQNPRRQMSRQGGKAALDGSYASQAGRKRTGQERWPRRGEERRGDEEEAEARSRSCTTKVRPPVGEEGESG